MYRRFQLTSILVLVAVLGSPGCRRSDPGASSVPSAGAAKSDRVAKQTKDRGIPPEKLGPILAAHYRGFGYMERYNYETAAEAFREVHSLAPEWVAGSINLAIALFYQGGRDHVLGTLEPHDEAFNLLDDVLKRNPDNLHAHYCRGLIYETAGLHAKAHSDFQFVVDHDPTDAHSWYMLGSTIDSPPEGGESDESEQSRLREQLADFQRAIECNPYSTEATYKLAMAYRRTGDRGACRRWLERWKELWGQDKGYGHGETIVYHERGRYARMVNGLVERPAGLGTLRPPRFGPATPLAVCLDIGERWASASDFIGPLAVIGRARARFGAPVAAFDADGDGKIDLFLPAAIVGRRGMRDVLLLNKGEGAFEDATLRLGLPGDHTSLGAAAGDFDADGRIDLFLTGVGDNRLFRNEGKGGFKDVTKAVGIAGPSAVSLTARWLDLDQDGDLDLYVVNYTGRDQASLAFTDQAPPGITNSVFRNEGKPSPVPGQPRANWTPAAVVRYPESGTSKLSLAMTPWPNAGILLGGISRHTGIGVLDLDGDRDLDFVLSAEESPPQAVLNDRVGVYRAASVKGCEPGFGERRARHEPRQRRARRRGLSGRRLQRFRLEKPDTPRRQGNVNRARALAVQRA